MLQQCIPHHLLPCHPRRYARLLDHLKPSLESLKLSERKLLEAKTGGQRQLRNATDSENVLEKKEGGVDTSH